MVYGSLFVVGSKMLGLNLIFFSPAKVRRRKEKMKENEIGEIIVDAALRNIHHEGHEGRE